MPLQKQSVPINFSQGLDLKSDPKQVQIGKFLTLQNSIFDIGGLLQKRNGFGELTTVPDPTVSYATTFNGNLTAIGDTLQAYSASTDTWVNKGNILPLSLSTLPLLRSGTNQSQCDSAVAANGLVCTVFTDNIPIYPTTTPPTTSPVYKYVVANSVTGQIIVAPTVINVTQGSTLSAPRVFVLGNNFIILVTNHISSAYHLQYFAVSSTNPTAVTGLVDISSSYIPATTLAFDAVVASGNLYIAWNTTTGGQSIKMAYMTPGLTLSATFTISSHKATMMSLCVDATNPTAIRIYASFYDSSSSTGYSVVTDVFCTVIASGEIITSGTIANVASAAQSGICTVFYETVNAYSYDSSIPSNYVSQVTMTVAGVVGTPAIVKRSVGLASKAFIVSGVIYALMAYQSSFQPSYYLVSAAGNIVSSLAYSNGGGYVPTGLPSVTVNNTLAQICYLYKDFIEALNTASNTAQTTTGGIYSQTGINLVSFNVGGASRVSSEIASTLNLSGGFVWSYDGSVAVEQSFFVWPDSVELSASTSGGSMTAQQYYYQVTYEWSDNQGNVWRSSPSIPVTVTTTGSTSSVTVEVPTLRLTYKTGVNICVYRWSAANEVYYQVTSIQAPIQNNTAVDSIAYVDTLADSSIIGNNILYTTGGVVEDISPPSTSIMTLFDTRLWLVDAEDQNLLWFSKQVIEATPVEMSDLFTLYVAPTISAAGSTGPITALSAMDDKLVIFKKDAIYYINGTGPDNTGANNQYSPATFITAVVGSTNPASLILQPAGIMFQSDKGIWLLGRDLSTSYIGAPVEALTLGNTVLSAVNVPGTNQIRFTMSSGVTLMYDYYYQQWGTFVGVPAISSTLYNGLHTFINASGAVFQETPGLYLDGSNPVLLGFTTSWIDLMGLQGYQRAYYFYLLGSYISPHKLNISISYDYNPQPTQVTLLTPDNYSPAWGGDALWGSGTAWGGSSTTENWRIFLQQQRCESFQIQIQELYDPSFGVAAGGGLTLSGLNLVIGGKKSYPTLRPSRSVG